MPKEPVIQVEDLAKTFYLGFLPYRWSARVLGRSRAGRSRICRVVQAVRGLSFSVEPGEIFGLLGPNGAGKTTTIKMIVGLLKPDRGRIRLFGQPSTSLQARRKLGFLPENPSFYDYLRAHEFLDLVGRLSGMSRAERRRKIPELLQLVGLQHATDRQLRRFSKGMLQRLGLAQALLADPQLVILDEPLSGLDPIGRKEIRDIIADLAAQGRTVLFSSHILSDVERLCHRVAIVHQGRIVDAGPLDQLLKAEVETTEVVLDGGSEDLCQHLEAFGTVRREASRCILVCEQDPTPAIRRALEAGARVVSVVPQTRSLEEIFVQRTAARTEEQRHGS